MSRIRRAALIAGSLYLVTHVTSVGAAVAYRAAVDSGSLALVQVGVALEVALALACVGNGVVLLTILRPYGPVGAYAFAGLRGLEAAVIAAGTLPMLVLVELQRPTGSVPDASLTASLTASLSALHEASFLVGQGLVIAVNTLILAGLLWRSRLTFPGIPALGFVGGALVLLSDVGQLFGVVERSGGLAMILAVPIFAFELWFAGYLLFIGVRPGRADRVVAREFEPAPAVS